jgi:hypothetical protein
MTQSIATGPVKLAGMVMLASLPLFWWAADRVERGLYFLVAAGVALTSATVSRLMTRSESEPGLGPARRAASRQSLVIAMVYLWGSLAILISYYATDLSWYHAYQYAIYLAIPGLLALHMSRRQLRDGPTEATARDLAFGRTLAWVQLVSMLAAAAYIVFSHKLFTSVATGAREWAAMSVLFWGALALAGISLSAVRDDRRLRGSA